MALTCGDLLQDEGGALLIAPALAVCRAAGGIEGIVNGMDTSDWCPTQDKFLDVKYDEQTVAHGKAVAKETLQAELGLPVRLPAWRDKP